MEIEWKKIASMEYGKIIFHSIPYHALLATKIVSVLPMQTLVHLPAVLWSRTFENSPMRKKKLNSKNL